LPAIDAQAGGGSREFQDRRRPNTAQARQHRPQAGDEDAANQPGEAGSADSSRATAFHAAAGDAFASDTINRRRWGNGRDGGPVSAGSNASISIPRGGGMHRRITHRSAMADSVVFCRRDRVAPKPL